MAVSESDESRKNGRVRGDNGCFVAGNPGGPGRPRGRPNQSAGGIRELRRRILESFDEPDDDGHPAGMVALRKLRSEAPKDYLRLVAALLPPEPPAYHERAGVRQLARLVQQRQGENRDDA